LKTQPVEGAKLSLFVNPEVLTAHVVLQQNVLTKKNPQKFHITPIFQLLVIVAKKTAYMDCKSKKIEAIFTRLQSEKKIDEDKKLKERKKKH
jgi:hypothetical protein